MNINSLCTYRYSAIFITWILMYLLYQVSRCHVTKLQYMKREHITMYVTVMLIC